MQPLFTLEPIPAAGIMWRLAAVSIGSCPTVAMGKTGAFMNCRGDRVSHSYRTAGQRELSRNGQGGAAAKRVLQFPRDPPQAEL